MIEIAALRVEVTREREFHRLCNPGRPLPAQITELAGPADADLPIHKLPDLVHHQRIRVERSRRALDDVRATPQVLACSGRSVPLPGGGDRVYSAAVSGPGDLPLDRLPGVPGRPA